MEVRDAGLDNFTQLKTATLSFVDVGLGGVVDAFGSIIDHTRKWWPEEAWKDAAKGILSDIRNHHPSRRDRPHRRGPRSCGPSPRRGGAPPTRGPTIAGEGPTPEAIIPLSRGRFVPVEIVGGGGGGNFTLVQNINDQCPELRSVHEGIGGPPAAVPRGVERGGLSKTNPRGIRDRYQ